jgi:hypothetical protein
MVGRVTSPARGPSFGQALEDSMERRMSRQASRELERSRDPTGYFLNFRASSLGHI